MEERVGIFFLLPPSRLFRFAETPGLYARKRAENFTSQSARRKPILLSSSYTFSLLGNSKYPHNLYHRLQEERHLEAGE